MDQFEKDFLLPDSAIVSVRLKAQMPLAKRHFDLIPMCNGTVVPTRLTWINADLANGRLNLRGTAGGFTMRQTEYARKLNELDRLLNDPEGPLDPARIWSLLADIARYEATAIACRSYEGTDGG